MLGWVYHGVVRLKKDSCMFQQVSTLRTDNTKHGWQVRVPAWNVIPHTTANSKVNFTPGCLTSRACSTPERPQQCQMTHLLKAHSR
jgi:hypothetical protein